MSQVRIDFRCTLALVFALGCGAAQDEQFGLRPGDPTAQPSFVALPPVAGHGLSEEMTFGWLLAQESLALAAPPLPRRRDAASVFHWADTDLKVWLARKQRTVQAARQELDEAAEQSHPQRILAGALVGLLYEDVSRILLTVPVPEELLRDPEILVVYREVVDAQASPYLEHARRAYTACALNAVADARFGMWQRYCAVRADRLPTPLRQAPLPSGETEVTVTREP